MQVGFGRLTTMVWDEKGGRGGGVGATTMIVWDDELSSWVGSVGRGITPTVSLQ